MSWLSGVKEFRR